MRWLLVSCLMLSSGCYKATVESGVYKCGNVLLDTRIDDIRFMTNGTVFVNGKEVVGVCVQKQAFPGQTQVRVCNDIGCTKWLF